MAPLQTRLIAVAFAIAVAAPAWAGCATYNDGTLSPAPRVITCFDGDCETTTLAYVCGNRDGTQFGYSNGWRGGYNVETGKDYLIRPNHSHVYEEDRYKFVCYAVDEDFVEGCGDRVPANVGTTKPLIDAGGEDFVEDAASAGFGGSGDLFSFSGTGSTLLGRD